MVRLKVQLMSISPSAKQHVFLRWICTHSKTFHRVDENELGPAPTRSSKGSCTLNLEDEDVLYSLQQRPLNGPLNLENAVGSSICRVSLNGSLSI
jgi:hypothetical protein